MTMDNIERTTRAHDATSHPSWAPGETVTGFIEKLHHESGERVRLPKSGAPADAEIVTDGATVDATRTAQIANEAYEAFTQFVNPVVGFGSPVCILTYDDERKRALIRNNDPAVNLVVGKLGQVQVGIGFLLGPGQQIEIKSRQAVYAAAATGGTSIGCSVWTERGY